MLKKKILLFIDWYLPGYKAGGPIQSVANMVEHLKDEFDFSIITRDTDYCETVPYTTVKSDQWNTLSNGIKVYYFSKKELNNKNIHKLINEAKADCIYLNGIYSFYFTLMPLFYLRKVRIPVIIAARGMLANSALGVKKFKKLLFIRSANFFKFFDHVLFHATNEIEKEDIKRAFGRNINIKTAGNLFQKTTIGSLPARIKHSLTLRLVNIARISPEKNLLYALEVLQEVKDKVEFDIFGPVYNQQYWQKCCDVINKLPGHIKVNYKGSIESDKVLDQLKHYHFMFMPTLGENFGHIILQSLSMGCPVIISDQTPWKQLGIKNIGWDIPLNQSELFIEVINKCAIMDQNDYNILSTSSYNFAKKYNSNEEIIMQNKNLFIL